jgi:hypothetical protein
VKICNPHCATLDKFEAFGFKVFDLASIFVPSCTFNLAK